MPDSPHRGNSGLRRRIALEGGDRDENGRVLIQQEKQPTGDTDRPTQRTNNGQ